MKGIFFDKPLEIRVEIAGDEFQQGSLIQGSIAVANRGSSNVTLSGVRLLLALGKTKKVQAKEDDAFTELTNAPLNLNGDLAVNAELKAQWSFQLDANCPITDKAQSLYLIYGIAGHEEFFGQLQLNIKPHAHLMAVLELLESSFQFVLKGLKSSNSSFSAKLKPSSAKRFSRVEELNLQLRLEDSALALDYTFKTKSLQATPSTLTIGKDKNTFQQRIEPQEFLTGEFINYQGLETRLNEALSSAASAF